MSGLDSDRSTEEGSATTRPPDLVVEIPSLASREPQGAGEPPAESANIQRRRSREGCRRRSSEESKRPEQEDGGSGSSRGAATRSDGGENGEGGWCSPPDPKGQEEEAECRICLMASDRLGMVAPCNCRGSLHYAHLACLLRWCKERVSTTCEICGSQYQQEVLPLLEAEVKSQRRQQQNAAELARGNMQRAEVAGEREGTAVSPERVANSSGWLMLKVLLVLALTGGLLYAIFFLGSQDGGATWASILLRVVIFVIPAWLVYRGVSACIAYRGGIVTRPPPEDPSAGRQ